MRSPPKPWKTGVHSEYTAFQIVMSVCQDSEGNLWSDHDFKSWDDEEACQKLQFGGVPQVASSLLLEAVRREIFTSALVKVSGDPDFIQKWAEGGPQERSSMELAFSSAIQTSLTKTLERLIPQVIPGVLEMLAQQGDLKSVDPE